MIRIGPALIDDAGISADGLYRYWLTRGWGDDPAFVNFICLNPSTADATRDDPTVRRLRGFARSWGYDGFWLTNLFAYRATDPEALCFAQGDISGPDNMTWLSEVASRAALVVMAWGDVSGLYRNNVKFAQRQASIVCQLALQGIELHALGFTKAGFPRHPLYMRSDTRPIPVPQP